MEKADTQIQCKEETDNTKIKGTLWTPSCRSCGATSFPQTQFVPIPVLVPIPVPILSNAWNSLDAVSVLCNTESLDSNLRMKLRAIQQRAAAAMLWPGVNPASLISPLITTGEVSALLSSVQHELFQQADVQTRTNSADRNTHDHPHVTNSSSTPVDSKTMTEELQSSTNTEKNDTEIASYVNGGYLQSERTYTSSESSDSDADNPRKPRVRRMYNVSGNTMRDSDDALPSSEVSSDEEKIERASHSSGSRDDMSSSGSEDTDTDDTGTVADQKPKKFTRVFVVNTNDSSSDIEDNTDSCSDTETSDNDTDTEKDCIILNYMKSLSEEENDTDEDLNETVVLLKHVKSSEDQEDTRSKSNDTEDSGIVLLKHVTCSSLNNSDIDEPGSKTDNTLSDIDSSLSENTPTNYDVQVITQIVKPAAFIDDCLRNVTEESKQKVGSESNNAFTNEFAKSQPEIRDENIIDQPVSLLTVLGSQIKIRSKTNQTSDQNDDIDIDTLDKCHNHNTSESAANDIDKYKESDKNSDSCKTINETSQQNAEVVENVQRDNTLEIIDEIDELTTNFNDESGLHDSDILINDQAEEELENFVSNFNVDNAIDEVVDINIDNESGYLTSNWNGNMKDDVMKFIKSEKANSLEETDAFFNENVGNLNENLDHNIKDSKGEH